MPKATHTRVKGRASRLPCVRRGADQQWLQCKTLSGVQLTECVWYGLTCIKIPNERKVISAVMISCSLLPGEKKEGSPTMAT